MKSNIYTVLLIYHFLHRLFTPQPKYKIILKSQNQLNDSQFTKFQNQNQNQQSLDTTSTEKYHMRRPFFAILRSNERITASDWEQDVRHIVLDITGSNITYAYSFFRNFKFSNSEFVLFNY
jgi:hypothetical protein